MSAGEAREAAGKTADGIRALNHLTRRPAADELTVADVYDLLADLGLASDRLPQLLTQLDRLVERLVEAGQVRIVDGTHQGDPVAAAATTGHWLVVGRDAAAELAHAIVQAQQTLTWASPS